MRDVIRADRFEDGVDTGQGVTGEADFEPRFREMWPSQAAVDSRQPHSLYGLKALPQPTQPCTLGQAESGHFPDWKRKQIERPETL